MIKKDWPKLKNEFVSGSWVTITAFFADKNIKNNSYARLPTNG